MNLKSLWQKLSGLCRLHKPKQDAAEEPPQTEEPTQAESEEQEAKPKRYTVISVVLVLAVALCLTVSIQSATQGYVSIAGFSVFRVVTGSMEPTVRVGEVLLCRSTPIEEIQTDDIVCYRSEFSEIRDAVVTHRVVLIEQDSAGELCLQTRGDANLATDPYPVRRDNLIGKVIWHSGNDGIFTRFLSFISSKIGFLSCIVIPILLVLGVIVQRAVKNLCSEIRNLRSQLRQVEAENEKDELLSGYTILTRKDYDEILLTLRAELQKELRNQENIQPPTHESKDGE